MASRFNSTSVDGVLSVTGINNSYDQGIRIAPVGDNGTSSIFFKAPGTGGTAAGMWALTAANDGFRIRGTASSANTSLTEYVKFNYGGQIDLTGSSGLTMTGWDLPRFLTTNITGDKSTGFNRYLWLTQVEGSSQFRIGVFGNKTSTGGSISYGYLGFNGYDETNFRVYSTGVKWGTNEFYHAGNSNNADTDWTCKTLTASSAVTTPRYYINSATSYLTGSDGQIYFTMNLSGSGVSPLVMSPTYIRRGTSASLSGMTLGTSGYPWDIVYGNRFAFNDNVYITGTTGSMNFAVDNKLLIRLNSDALSYGGGTGASALTLGSSERYWSTAYTRGIVVSPSGSTGGLTFNRAGINYITAPSGTTGTSIVFVVGKPDRGMSASTVAIRTSAMVPGKHNTFSLGTSDSGWSAVYAVAYYENSDRRLKENIEPLENRGYLEPVEFNFKTDKKKKHLGFIAQDVQELYPELVYEGDDGMLSLNYPEITAVLAAQVNELRKENESLRKEIDEIKELIKSK